MAKKLASAKPRARPDFSEGEMASTHDRQVIRPKSMNPCVCSRMNFGPPLVGDGGDGGDGRGGVGRGGGGDEVVRW